MSNDGAAAFTTGHLNDTHTVFGPQLTAMTNLTPTTQNMRRTKQNKQLIQSLKAFFSDSVMSLDKLPERLQNFLEEFETSPCGV